MTSPLNPWSEEVLAETVERQRLLDHDGTLDTTGHGNGDVDRVGGFGVGEDRYEVHLGADNSAAAISPALRDEIDPADLPDGYVAGPEPRTAPIY